MARRPKYEDTNTPTFFAVWDIVPTGDPRELRLVQRKINTGSLGELSVVELARVVGVRPRTVRSWIESGVIAPGAVRRAGLKLYRIKASEAERLRDTSER